MDFFARQDAARRATRLLVASFMLAMVAMALVVHLVIGALSQLLGGSGSPAEPAAPALVLIGMIWLTVLSGAYFRALDVRAGGDTLARRFGALPIPEGTRDEGLRRLSDTVAEMAIAAGVPTPAVRIMPRERAINAFVLGAGVRRAASSAREDDDAAETVLVVTRGAVDALDADELRGVVAHEMAHIAQGDLPLNMRLLIALGGLAALDEVGRTLTGRSALGGASPGPCLGAFVRAPAHPAALVGWLLRALGSVGVLAGGLLRAAVSRGREHLADATAVQFTREPSALASALATIRDADTSPPHAPLRTAHAEELAHLCFHGGRLRARWRRAFAAHPPLQSRIDALDPHVDLKRRKREVRKVSAAARAERLASGPASVVISDRLQLLLSDGTDCIAVLCALFAEHGGRGDRCYAEELARGFGTPLAARMTALQVSLRAEIESDRLALTEQACGVLRESATPERRRQFLLALEGVLAACGELDLADYATLRLLRRRLDAEFPVLVCPGGGAVRSFASMGEQFALLLSLLVESSGAPTPALEREFRRVLSCYTDTPLPRRTRGEPGIVVELERAFQTLAAQPLAVRRGFVQHCADIVEADGRVVPAERTLLELIAASLDEEDRAA